MRLLALVLTLTVTGPSVASLVCDWACAARYSVAEVSGGCHEHGSDAATPTMARGPQCHDISPALESVLTTAMPIVGVPAAAEAPLAAALSVALNARSAIYLPQPSHAPPPQLIPLRI